MNRMNCLYDLILFFNILVQAEVVVSVVLSLFVRESFVGKFLDPLAAARVVQVSRPLHRGLWSAEKPGVTYLELSSHGLRVHTRITISYIRRFQINTSNNESMYFSLRCVLMGPRKWLMHCLVKFVPSYAYQARTDFTNSRTSHFHRPSTGSTPSTHMTSQERTLRNKVQEISNKESLF